MAVSDDGDGRCRQDRRREGTRPRRHGRFQYHQRHRRGTNALRLAALRHKNAIVDKNATFNDFYISLISRIGSQGEEAADRIKNQETILKNLANLRESVSGINLDEEMANMIAFQHGYNASARVINTMTRCCKHTAAGGIKQCNA